ncbi:MAG: membrane protein FxsA, partial [Rhizobiaceae bacterium]|nr:membrane protein FxsA [Rhizobiaceae bacterium]
MPPCPHGKLPTLEIREPVRLFPLIVLLLPLIEIAGFVVVGSHIGVLWTIALVLASTVAGSVLLRYQGFGVMNRMRAEVEAGRDPSREVAHGVMILLAAILLLIPGFVTDIFGILLFIPPVREIAWRFLKRRVN